MMKKILLAVAVLVCALSFTACCCTEDATACTDEAAPAAAETPVETLDPAKAPVVDLIDKSVFDACMAKDAQVPEDLVKDKNTDLCCKIGFAKYVSLTKKTVFEKDTNGVRYARVHGKMNGLPFLEWLVSNDGPRLYRYRFLLIGKDGKKVFTPVQTRMITPGDAVRFSVEAPENYTGAILLLDDAE